MKIEKDYEDLLKLLNKNNVQYCIVGGYAVAFYAKPRFTKDLDIFVKATLENGERIIRALVEFGFSSFSLKDSDFAEGGKIIQLGYAPIRVDFITSIDGCDFNEVWNNRIEAFYGKERVFFISLKDLIKNKKATKRKEDEIDLNILEKLDKNPKQKKRRV